jgi:hypothetical protein
LIAANIDIALTLPSYFDVVNKQPDTTTSTWPYAVNGSFATSPSLTAGDSGYSQWGYGDNAAIDASGGVSGNPCIALGTANGAANASVQYLCRDFVPGESTCFWMQVKGNGKVPLKVNVVYTGANATSTSSMLLFTYVPTTGFTSVWVCVTPPVWCSSFNLTINKPLAADNGIIWIDAVRQMMRG